MEHLDSQLMENCIMKKVIDHPGAPSRKVRDQLVRMALFKGGLWGWMPDSSTDPENKFHYSWPRCQHTQIDIIVNWLVWSTKSKPWPWMFQNPWK